MKLMIKKLEPKLAIDPSRVRSLKTEVDLEDRLLNRIDEKIEENNIIENILESMIAQEDRQPETETDSDVWSKFDRHRPAFLPQPEKKSTFDPLDILFPERRDDLSIEEFWSKPMKKPSSKLNLLMEFSSKPHEIQVDHDDYFEPKPEKEESEIKAEKKYASSELGM